MVAVRGRVRSVSPQQFAAWRVSGDDDDDEYDDDDGDDDDDDDASNGGGGRDTSVSGLLHLSSLLPGM